LKFENFRAVQDKRGAHVTHQLKIVLYLERADRAICHLGLSSIIILVEGLRFCLTSQYRGDSQTHVSNAPVQTFRLGYLQRATLADNFLLVCPSLQFQENEINPNLICSLYISLRIVAHCLRTFEEKVLVYFDVYGVNVWRFVHS
jgi:hypothetical protein